MVFVCQAAMKRENKTPVLESAFESEDEVNQSEYPILANFSPKRAEAEEANITFKKYQTNGAARKRKMVIYSMRATGCIRTLM